jgi:1-phosphofructokinase family hexose kinase
MGSKPVFLVVTSNPAIDRRIHVAQLAVSEVNRATQVENGAGGKGLNVVRAARTLGCHAIATAPLGGHTGHLFADLAAAEGLDTDWYWLGAGDTRISMLITHNNSDTTVINEPGPTFSKKDWLEFLAHIRRLANQSDAIAFSGSFPPGVGAAEFCALARSLVLPERNVYLDTSGEVLQLALAQPDGLCIKVNREELAAGLQQPLAEISDVVKAGQMILTRGAALVVVTLGRKGAIVITSKGCWQANSPAISVTSTVGSGDSLLAGFAVSLLNGGSIKNALKLGVACGAANAKSHLPGRFEQKMVEELLLLVDAKRVA